MNRKILVQTLNGCKKIRSFSRCSQQLSVPGSSLVDTSEGLVQVQDLVNKNFELVSNGDLVSSKGFKEVKMPNNIYKITTKNNFSITCSDNTRFLVKGQNKKEEPYFKCLKNLEIGDAVYFNWGQSQKYVFDKEVDQEGKDLGWLVGEVIGDGCHNSNNKFQTKAIFCCKNREVLAWHAYEIANLYLPKTKQQLRYSKGPSSQGQSMLKVQLKCLTDLCSRYITDYDKNIKLSTLKESKPFLMGLIQGFLDADGHVSAGKTSSEVVLSNTNLHNLIMVQSILRWMGITSGIFSSNSIRKYKITNRNGTIRQGNCKSQHKLSITYLPNMLKYKEFIDFNDPSKREKLILVIKNRKLFKAFRGFLKITKIQLVEKQQGQKDQFFVLKENQCFGCNGFYIHVPHSDRNNNQQYSRVFVNRWQVENDLIRQKWEQQKNTTLRSPSNST